MEPTLDYFIKKLRELEIPQSPENLALLGWVADLSELDSYLYNIAQTLSASSVKLQLADLDAAQVIVSKLNSANSQLWPLSDSDLTILDHGKQCLFEFTSFMKYLREYKLELDVVTLS